jgi:hypothetical protein
MNVEGIRDILDAVRKFRQLFPSLTWSELAEIFKLAQRLYPFPDLADEAGCRMWCRNACIVAAEVADLTDIGWDDNVVAAVAKIPEDDQLWALAWAAKEWIVSANDVADPGHAQRLGDSIGVNPEMMADIIEETINFFD